MLADTNSVTGHQYFWPIKMDLNVVAQTLNEDNILSFMEGRMS